MDQKHENAVVSAGSNDKTSDSGNDGRRLKRKRDSSPGPGLQTPSQKNRGDSGDLLPPMSPSQQGKYTLVIDMDGTILAELDQRPEIPIDFAVEQISTGKRTFILKRPGLEEFLQQVAELFEIVVFTESCKRRADVLLNMLENRGCIAHRLYRESCTEVFGKLAKDLSLLGRDLKKVIIMDDCPYTYVLQPRNALPVRWYYGNPNDRELQKVSDGLRKLGRGRRDIRFIVDTIEHPSMTTIIGHSQLLQPSGRHTLVLDMDGTILVERREKLPENEGSDYFKTLEISDDGKKTKLYIYKRPGLDRFLKEMAELFEIVVFTASSKSRADYFLDEIDTHKFISSRLYRDSCYSEIQLKFVKDLFQLGRDLKRVIIVDDTPISYEFQQTNAIPIIPFQGFKTDTALEELTPFLRILAQKDDVRPLLYQKFDVQIRLLDNI